MADNRRADPDLVHKIVVEEKRMENPYSDLPTLVDKLNKLKPYLVSVAQEGGYTTYMKTAEDIGIFTARQSQVLGVLGLHEDEQGNPPLSALVVQSRDPPMVGDKYFNMIDVARNQTNDIPSTPSGKRKLWQNHVQQVREHWA